MTTLLLCILAGAPGDAAEFFEARVRPILAESCFGCHGAEKQKGGLRLDSRENVIKGSDSGPVVVMGEPDKSPMILAIRHAGDIKMPPRGKLPDDAIEALATWVKLGAPWPGSPSGAATAAVSRDPRKEHWAFQPIRDPPVPAVKDEAWAATPLDHFILEKLEERAMTPRPKADRRALLRRMTFDLTGLPPTAEEVAEFAADASPNAVERAIDRLLASPRYGERWGRYWLDVARYADNKGYVFEEERRFPYSYTYRDYVVRALNEDVPYDQFVVEQIAADLLPQGEDRRSLAAMGFLTLGRRFLNNTPDIIDDRIDVVSRGIMGLTVTCARCHDHKFDPIPTADYYSLYGVFASAREPKELPLVGKPEQGEAYAAFEKELATRDAAVQKLIDDLRLEFNAELRKRTGDYLLAAAAPQGDAKPEALEKKARNIAAGELNPLVTARWRDYLAAKRKEHDPVLAPWLAFADLKPEELGSKGAQLSTEIAAGALGGKPIHPLVAKLFGESPPGSLAELAERYGKLFASVEAPAEPADPAREEVRKILFADGSPASIPPGEIERFFNRAARGKIRDGRKKVEEWKVTSPGAPPRAMSLEDSPEPNNPVIFIRGNAGNPGKAVPRQFLGVLSKEQRPFEHGSGRLELARAIASRDNPLTARVMVNRVWLHFFGAGLVRTPGDFGTRSEPPTHPELLDWLASRFMDEGWSLKKLHKRILLSSAYEQSSEVVPEYEKADPENRLVWRMTRRRLDFEALRDSLLFATGRLDEKPGGPAVDITKAPYTMRRTIYGFIDRQNLPGLFRTFDFASPDTTSPARFSTTVPQQALFLMNSPFVIEQVKALAARPDVASKSSERERIQALHRAILARDADDEEISLGARYVEKTPVGADPKLSRWESYAQVLLLSNEFAYVD